MKTLFLPQADLANPPPLAEFLQTKSQRHDLPWDLSDTAIESRNDATLALLQKWEAEGDEQEQAATWEFLIDALNEKPANS